MSDTIPPLYSSSPPPLTKSNFADDGESEEDEDDDDDEYGKFEEYSAVYDHTVEEILNNSPRKPIKSESKATLSFSESITGKNITDSPNNLHCTTDLNSSSVPLSSDILHSKSSDGSINCKVLENNSINFENTFSDSAINFLEKDNVSIVNRDNLSSDNSSKSFSEPVTIENSINGTESITERIQVRDKNSCDSSGCNDSNIYASSELSKSTEKQVSSNVNSFGVSSIPIVNNCSNLTSTVGGSLNDDDFEFDDFQSFSEQTPSTLNFVTDIPLVEKSVLIQETNTLTTAESISHNDMPNIEAAFAQSDVNHEHSNNDTFSSVTNNVDDRTDNLSMFKKSETNLDLGTSGSPKIIEVNSAVHKNSNDLTNGFSVFKNMSDSGNVTTVESNLSPVSSANIAAALESNQITDDIMKAEKKSAESNSESAPLNLADKVISEPVDSNEDDGFGDFEFANAPQGSTIESSNHVSNAQSRIELLSDDDFCDFESVNTLTMKKAENKESLVLNETEFKAKECPAFEADFTSFASHYPADKSDDFSDFKSTNVDMKISPSDSKTAESSTDSGDNFGDFKVNFSETSADIAVASSSKFDDGAEEEFDDFTDFSTYDQSSVPKLDTVEPAAHEGDKFWIKLFPPCEEGVREIDVVSISDLVVASRIWTKLRDMESSQALVFEWSKSTSYNKYLSSLKIDVRNVFGVQWRSNVPRFAANLGCAPLEPSKAAKDINLAKPVSGQSTEPSQSNHPDIVPAAHFDWISSGLVNPLDGTKRKGAPAPVPKQKAKDEAIDTEVQEFLQSLPDLSFMLVSHIQFPMNPTNADKSS